ncbi:MAG: hypothetical protein V3U43_07160 [Pseudomonadales bacterium]
MSSAYSITRSVNPPRAVYLDYPLGHTAGKPGDPKLQRAIMLDTLGAFESIEQPGTIEVLHYTWTDSDDWKDSVMRPSKEGEKQGDGRVERFDTPQYQTEADEAAAQEALAEGGCPTCIWLE